MACVPEANMAGLGALKAGAPPSGFCSGVSPCAATLVEELSARMSVVTSLGANGWPRPCVARQPGLEAEIRELFRLHDLNGNGTLEEDELVQLNAKVAILHYGHEVDLAAVKDKYRRLFREKLDKGGCSVSFAVFRRYLLQVLDSLDPDPKAQEMIAEQFTLEAKAARAVFHLPSFASVSDLEFLSKISCSSFYDEGTPATSSTIARFPSSLTDEDELGSSSPAGGHFAEEEMSATQWEIGPPCATDRSQEEFEREVGEPIKPRQPPTPRRPPSFMAGYGGA